MNKRKDGIGKWSFGYHLFFFVRMTTVYQSGIRNVHLVFCMLEESSSLSYKKEELRMSCEEENNTSYIDLTQRIW